MCNSHYARLKRYGDPLGGGPPRNHGPIGERWWAMIKRVNGLVPPITECWEWAGHTETSGYGIIEQRVNGKRKSRAAHRVGYELIMGPVDPILDMDHLCRNPSCVNFTHLEPVTHQENGRRGIAGAHWAEKRAAKAAAQDDD